MSKSNAHTHTHTHTLPTNCITGTYKSKSTRSRQNSLRSSANSIGVSRIGRLHLHQLQRRLRMNMTGATRTERANLIRVGGIARPQHLAVCAVNLHLYTGRPLPSLIVRRQSLHPAVHTDLRHCPFGERLV